MPHSSQLKYYIALAAPPTRTPATGDEPFMRAEAGFNPSWFHKFCGIEFLEQWHQDPEYRLRCHHTMAAEIKRRFPGYNIGGVLDDAPPDLLTGTFGAGIVDMLFGRAMRYFPDKWPVPVGEPLTDEEADSLAVPDLNNSELFQSVLAQLDRIHQLTGAAGGFLNWQGVLNIAFRLRGQEIFIDMLMAKDRAGHIFNVIADTMIQGMKMLHARQREYGVDYHFATISNCTVNMAGPDLYSELLLPCDLKIRQEFRDFAIHNCAWTVTPYLDAYAQVPGLGYLDMGIDSDMQKARRLFPDTRRNLLYTSMDLNNKSEPELRQDFERIAAELGPCDLGLPDIENDVPDDRIMYAMDLCRELSEQGSRVAG